MKEQSDPKSNSRPHHLLERSQAQNPLQVPVGYFEQLTSNIMAAMPLEASAQKSPRIHFWYKKSTQVAAVALILLLSSISFLVLNSDSEIVETTQLAITENTDHPETASDDQYIEDVIGYAGINDYTIYEYLTLSDTE